MEDSVEECIEIRVLLTISPYYSLKSSLNLFMKSPLVIVYKPISFTDVFQLKPLFVFASRFSAKSNRLPRCLCNTCQEPLNTNPKSRSQKKLVLATYLATRPKPISFSTNT